MWAEKFHRDQRGRCAPGDGGARQAEACVGGSRSRSRRVEGTRPPQIWPGARLIARPEPRFGPCVWPGPARRGVDAFGSKGVGLKSLRPVAFVLPRSGCVGFRCFGPPKGCWERMQVGEFGVHHSILRKPTSPKCDLCGFCEFRTDRFDRLRDFGRDRRAFPPTNSGARPIWSGRTSFR